MEREQWVRPEGAVIDMQLKKERLMPDESLELTFKLHNLSSAELLAWYAELGHRVSRRFESLVDESTEVVNEGTDDEDTVLDEQKFKEAKLKISEEAKKLLMDNFSFSFEGIDDLFEFLNIEWEH